MRLWNLALMVFAAACSDDGGATNDGLRLNELQAIGTHNSYHLNPGTGIVEHDYAHPPLDVQLDAGGRHFELDVHVEAGTNVVKVYHIKGGDERTTCDTFADCLGVLRTWSDAHPDHHLLVVLVEPKDDIARLMFEVGNDPAESGELMWDGHAGLIDPVIRAAWPDRVLTPAAVQGRHASLREAIETDGWPTIDDTRGHIAFVLNDGGLVRTEYSAATTAADRLMFLFPGLGEYTTSPDAAFVKADDPRSEGLRAAVEAGFIVRTRADGDGTVDAAETELALGSGAHLVSSDYLVPDDEGRHPGYRVPWPGTAEHPSRCNPVSARAGCADEDVE